MRSADGARANVIPLKFAFLSAAALALAGGALLRSSWSRIERAAEADIRQILGGKAVGVHAEPDGLVGSAMGRVESVKISASGFTVDGMPLFCDPELSQKGRMKRLQISLREFVIRDLPVQELTCDIPNNRFALGMLLDGKVRLSKSGEGVGAVTISQSGLADYVKRRFGLIESIEIKLDKYKLFAKGTASMGILKRDFEIICDLVIAEKRRLEIANPIVFINGARVRDGSDASLLRALNPVLDLDRDLGLSGAFDMERIRVKDGLAVINGRARIPNRPTALASMLSDRALLLFGQRGRPASATSAPF